MKDSGLIFPQNNIRLRPLKSVCWWQKLEVISDMVFYTSQGRSFGPYGKCGKGHQTQYTRFRDEYSKRHVRLDKLKDQVQLTANKYAGNKYVKLFKKMGKFYD